MLVLGISNHICHIDPTTPDNPTISFYNGVANCKALSKSIGDVKTKMIIVSDTLADGPCSIKLKLQIIASFF